jgi:hypothetical protein
MKPSYSFGLLNICTLLLLFAKLEDEFYIRWEFVFMPTILLCLIKISSVIFEILKYEEN